MKILMTGATGNVGNYVGRRLVQLGHKLVVVSRSKDKTVHYLEFPAEVIEHNLATSALTAKDFEGVDAIVHLMGETIDGRWTAEKKQNILNSRKTSSENLLKHLPESVKTIVSASAQGIYGDQGARWVSENAKLGDDFLADVCKAWEKPFQELKNVRHVQLRIGLVLDPQFGALKKMIPMFQKGLGGILGDGSQYMSWISIEDLTEVIVESLNHEKYCGPVNCGTENPVTNQEWTQIMRLKLGVMASPPVPELALKVALGEMADVVMASTRMRPEKLLQNGFKFKYNTLEHYFSESLEPFKDGKYFFSTKQYVPHQIENVFSFFSEAKNLEKITPPFLNFSIDKMSTDKICEGTLIDYKLKIKGFPVRWKTLIADWSPPYRFVDKQITGPYKLWHHSHYFEKLGAGTLISDQVRYQLPMGFLGRVAASSFVQNDVEKIFKFRREVIHTVKF